MTDTGLDWLELALDGALGYSENAFVKPVALLWPDKERQWAPVVARLRHRRRIVSHGEFDPAQRSGPAYWVRCAVASTVALDDAPEGPPIVYLPGFSRDDLRDAGGNASDLAPLAALAHRSQWFAHPNGKDWTIRALLSNDQKGLGLDIDGDASTAAALAAGVAVLIQQPLARLQGRHIDADFIAALVNPDPIRFLLEWINDPNGTRAAMDAGAWIAFQQHCKSNLSFDPSVKGEIEAARLLGEADGTWAEAWRRFRASGADYPGIRERLRQAQPELLPKNPGAWPGVSETAEEKLRSALGSLKDESAAVARQRILELEHEHGARRGHVWADLGWTPLVLALEHIAALAMATSASAAPGSVAAIAQWYADTGWQADRAAVRALDEVERKVDCVAVNAAIAAVYGPWLDALARAFQEAIGPAANAGTYKADPAPVLASGEVAAFVDGLRLDVAHNLVTRLAGMGLTADLTTALAALPTVTPTAKPALVPIAALRLGPGKELDARRAPDGPSATIAVLRKLMDEAGVQVLGPDDLGDPATKAWTEVGEIDQRGHVLGLELAHSIDDLVERIASRVRELLAGGWQKVTIVTDHGWHLVPGGLPKNEGLKPPVTAVRKGRCARIKQGAPTDLPTVPWHWDRDVRIALAPGIGCFEANQVYEHGGASPQECVVPRITVTAAAGAQPAGAEVAKARWRGLTFVVEFAALPAGATVDLRTDAGDPGSSVAERSHASGPIDKFMLLVENEDLEGTQVRFVVVAKDQTLILDRPTTVGHNE